MSGSADEVSHNGIRSVREHIIFVWRERQLDRQAFRKRIRPEADMNHVLREQQDERLSWLQADLR